VREQIAIVILFAATSDCRRARRCGVPAAYLLVEAKSTGGPSSRSGTTRANGRLFRLAERLVAAGGENITAMCEALRAGVVGEI